MQCHNHPDKEAIGICTVCGEFFCKDCLVNDKGKNYCISHTKDKIYESSVKPLYPPITEKEESPKSRLTCLILCFLFGWLGVHRFYVGKMPTGLLYVLTFGLFGIGWLVDTILILVGKFKDGNQKIVTIWS